MLFVSFLRNQVRALRALYNQTSGPLTESGFSQLIRALFIIGQVPIIFLTLGILILTLVFYHSAAETPWQFGAVIGLGVLSLVLSYQALQNYKMYGKTIFLLYASLAATASYLHYLVALTGGSSLSPFHHLYLYLPAVVLIVSDQNHKAELISSAAVLVSYCFNHDVKSVWFTWADYHETASSLSFGVDSAYHVFEIAFFTILLAFLILVNRHMVPVRNTTPPPTT
jgi:hypothetical protein